MALFGALSGIQAGMSAGMGAGTPPMPGGRRNAGSSLRAGRSYQSFAGSPPPARPRQQRAPDVQPGIQSAMRAAEQQRLAGTPPEPKETPMETHPDGYAGVPKLDVDLSGLDVDMSGVERATAELQKALGKGSWMHAFDGLGDVRAANIRGYERNLQIEQDKVLREAARKREQARRNTPVQLGREAGMTPEGQLLDEDPVTGARAPSWIQTRDETTVMPGGNKVTYRERAPRMAESLAAIGMRGAEDAIGDARQQAGRLEYLDASTAAAKGLAGQKADEQIRVANVKGGITADRDARRSAAKSGGGSTAGVPPMQYQPGGFMPDPSELLFPPGSPVTAAERASVGGAIQRGIDEGRFTSSGKRYFKTGDTFRGGAFIGKSGDDPDDPKNWLSPKK